MRCFVSLIATATLVTVPLAPATAQQAKVFAPDSAWAVDYGDNYCRLLRDFKSGNDVINLVVERTQYGPSVRILAIGDSLKTFRGATEINYRMLPAGAERSTLKLAGESPTGQTLLNLGSTTVVDMPRPAAGERPPRYDPAAESKDAAAITGISLEKGMSTPIQLNTGPMDGPVAALQACADDLLTTWGLDPAKHKTATRRAAPATEAASWLPAGTIPMSEFSKLSGGNNELRVMVDATGKPTACHVQWPSLSAALNDTICKAVVEKGRFTPAQDAAGQPMASYWATSLYGLMPPRGR